MIKVLAKLKDRVVCCKLSLEVMLFERYCVHFCTLMRDDAFVVVVTSKRTKIKVLYSIEMIL